MTKMVPPEKTTMSSTGPLLRVFIYCFFYVVLFSLMRMVSIYIYELVLQEHNDIITIITIIIIIILISIIIIIIIIISLCSGGN